MGSPVVHFEIGGPDDGPLLRFYGELFGWKLNDSVFPAYGLVDTDAGGRGIGGGLGAGGDNRWATVHASVPDVEQTLAAAERLGATRVYGPNAVDDHMQTGRSATPPATCSASTTTGRTDGGTWRPGGAS